MKDYQEDFIKVCVENQILEFKDEGFVLKSGRVSPYFFNAGLFDDGKLLTNLSHAYARTLSDPENSFQFDHVFGPAYKGIPLAVATCQMLASLGMNVSYAFNRKEVKDHGEGGCIVGAPINGKNIVIIDDVITSGTAIRETVDIITKSGGNLTGILVAVDRQEKRGDSEDSAIDSLRTEFRSVNIQAIITLDDIIAFAKRNGSIPQGMISRLEAYQEKWGVKLKYDRRI
jgi:orotate phosphoribosyltransferase